MTVFQLVKVVECGIDLEPLNYSSGFAWPDLESDLHTNSFRTLTSTRLQSLGLDSAVYSQPTSSSTASEATRNRL